MEFSLEENEDAESMTTVMYVHPDLSVTFGDTTGPPPVKYEGELKVEEDTGSFQLSIERMFQSGIHKPPSSVNQVSGETEGEGGGGGGGF